MEIILEIDDDLLKRLKYIQKYESEFDNKKYSLKDAIKISIKEYSFYSGYTPISKWML